MPPMRPVLACAVIAAAIVGLPSIGQAAPVNEPVQLVAINDLHGRLATVPGAEGLLVTGPGRDGVYGGGASEEDSDDAVTRVGGATNMAATVQLLQSSFRREAGGSAASFVVGAGDLIGESPPESAKYAEEPTIEMLNAIGLDVSAVGNWEFDRGTTELRRLSAATDGQYTDDVTACQGITPGVDGCFGKDEHSFAGADFPYLAANAISLRTGEPMFPPYQIFYTPEGTRLGLIGVTTKETTWRAPGEKTADVQFIDEADAVNRWVPVLRDQGVEAIGVLVHEGGEVTGPMALDYNACDGLTGPIVDINARIDAAVDLIVSGHTHSPYTCLLPSPGGAPRLVTQGGAHGRLVTDIRLTLDRGTGDVDRAATYRATNVPTNHTASDGRLQGIVAYWVAGPGNQPADPGNGNPSADTPALETAARDYGTELSVALGVVLVAVAAGAVILVRSLRRRRVRRR